MKRCLYSILLSLFIFGAGMWPAENQAYAEEPVVHAILFFSRTCPHCHKVMTEDLPPLVEQYGEQLSILVIDTVPPQGRDLFLAATEYYQIPPEQQGVPLLIVGDTVLMGSLEIPQKFPDIVEEGLAAGGIDWPELPALHEMLAAQGLIQPETPSTSVENIEQPVNETTAEIPANPDINLEEQVEAGVSGEGPGGIAADLEAAALATENMSLAQRFAQDSAGNTLSVVVLLGLIVVLLRAVQLFRHPGKMRRPWPSWVVPVLALVGTAVALYMGYVEITKTEAVCGPVGNCNTVQQSPYAYLFGLIPIGVLGIFGYAVIGLTWLVMRYGPVDWRPASTLTLWFLALFGTVFSIYLTFLEPFVIGASCAWCLSSAVVMALLLWATTIPVAQTRLAYGR